MAIMAAAVLTSVGIVTVRALGAGPVAPNVVTSDALKEAGGRGHRQSLPEGHRQALLEKGYSQSDIDQATELAWQYTWSVDHLLQWHRSGTDWTAIADILKAQGIVPKPEYDKLMPLEFGPNGEIRSAERTWSGMSRDQVALLAQTHSLEDIRKADSLAVALGKAAPDLLDWLKREGSWSKVLTAVEAAGRPQSPTGGSRLKLDQGGRSRSGLTAEQLNGLVAQGFDAEEVMRADVYAAQTGGSAERALALRKTGVSWADVLQRLRSESETVSGTNLTGAQFGALQAKGFDRSDIATAASVSAATGQTVEQVLQARGTRPWPEYIQALMVANPQARAYFTKLPQLQVQTLSQEAAQALISQGFSPQDVLIADTLSSILIRPAVEILAEKGSSDWDAFTKQLAESAPEVNAALMKISTEGDPRPMPTRSGLKEGEFRSLLASGYSYENIEAADAYAGTFGLSVRQLLKLNETTPWEEIGRALAERTRLASADDQERAGWVARGFTDTDIRQAMEISRITGRSYQSILAMKTPARTWLDIASELKPGKTPPVHRKGDDR